MIPDATTPGQLHASSSIVTRTEKYLRAQALAVPVVCWSWVEESRAEGQWRQEDAYLVAGCRVEVGCVCLTLMSG